MDSLLTCQNSKTLHIRGVKMSNIDGKILFYPHKIAYAVFDGEKSIRFIDHDKFKCLKFIEERKWNEGSSRAEIKPIKVEVMKEIIKYEKA